MRYAILTVASLALVAVAVALSLWDRFIDALSEPAGSVAVPVVVNIEAGETWDVVLPRLVEKGLIKDIETVRTYLARFHDPQPLAPGEYALSQAMGVAELVAHLESNQRVKRPVDIPEGATVRSAAKLLSEAGIVSADAFMAAARDRALLDEIKLSGPGVEGYLFPEVYSFARGTPADAVIKVMVGAFDAAYRRAVGDRTNGLSRPEVVTLASLIQQAPVPRGERRLFSAVLRNRLRARIPLQIEAARTYANGMPDDAQAAWDTFSRAGLPPGPICSPGTGALLAAANPATSRALYMVARSNGTHVFCDDLDCLYEESRRHERPLPRPLPLPMGRAPASP